jgi:hypothetical protein
MNTENTNLTAPGNLSADWLAKLAEAAKATQLVEKASSNFFSTKGGTLTWNGMALPGNKMECIVLLPMHENLFYKEKFDASSPASPDCYAFSFDGEAMAPHPEAENPQAKACKDCPNLKWGTSDNGRGKACRETRRLCLLPSSAAASPQAVAAAEAGLLRVPITSVKHWAALVNKLSVLQLPPFAMITEVSVHNDAKTMFRVEFAAKRAITDEDVLAALMVRIESERNNMSMPYPKREAPAPGTAAPAKPGKF